MHSAIYQAHLDRVSRSFALCIAQLEQPLRDWVALSYLMCRLLDTIEDASWPSLTERSAAYQRLQEMVEACRAGRGPAAAETAEWVASLPGCLPLGEQLLAADTRALCQALAALSLPVRQAICATVLQMGAGMRHFASRQLQGAPLVLSCLADVNRYCYFVAGTVGQLLTHLFRAHQMSFRPPASFLKNAFHFGLFLQKVNMLKDQGDDQRQGRFLVPDRAVLVASARANAEGALAYLSALPREAQGFRVFCAWSLFLGAATLPVIARTSPEAAPAKLARATTLALLAEVAQRASDDAWLAARLADLLAELPAPAAGAAPAGTPPPRADLAWFRQRAANFLAPSLQPAELAELQML